MMDRLTTSNIQKKKEDILAPLPFSIFASLLTATQKKIPNKVSKSGVPKDRSVFMFARSNAPVQKVDDLGDGRKEKK